MHRQVLEIRKITYYVCAWAFTFLNFLAFLVSRDHDRIHNPGQAWMDASSTEFRNYPASEFERTLSCHGIGQCQRIGGALIFQPLIFLADSISKFYYWNVDDQSRIFIIQIIGLSWRVLALGILAYCLYRVTKNIVFVLFAMNSLFFSLSGWLLRIFGKVIEVLKIGSDDFQARSVLAFQDFPYENFKWYDFGLFAVLTLIAILITKLDDNNLSKLKFLLLGILFTSFFEYLGFVFAFSLIIYSRSNKQKSKQIARNRIKQGVVIMFGSFIWLGFIAVYHRLMQSFWPKFFMGEKERATQHALDVFWAVQHPIENLTSNPSILFQIVLVLFQCSLLATITGLITRICLKPISIDPKFVMAFKSVTLAMTAVIFVTVFMAYGVRIQAGEHARQTLGLQISLFIYLFIKTASNKKSPTN